MDGYSSDMNIHQGYFPSKRYARIETQDFPEKFSIISRLKKETFTVGPRGEVLKSSVLPRVQVKVPDGAVSSGTKITLQVSARALILHKVAVLSESSHFSWRPISAETKAGFNCHVIRNINRKHSIAPCWFPLEGLKNGGCDVTEAFFIEFCY